MDQLTSEQREMVERNVPLVEHIVKRMLARFPAGYERDDLVQAGTVGLMEATTRFDPTQGIAFSTFAGRRIEGAIIDQLRRDDWAPRSVRAGERRLEQAEAELTARRGTRPDDRALGTAMGVDAGEVSRLRARIAAATVESLDRSVNRDDTATTLAETVADLAGLSAESEIDERELRGYLRDAVALLPERHRMVVVGHFFEGRSMTELGELLGVTQSRASQLKEDALGMMRRAIEAQYRTRPVERHTTRREREYTEALRHASPWRARLAPAGVPA
jgi:RNA polymerase sigma factor for flagellar operon FliA